MIHWTEVHPNDCLILEDGGNYLMIKVSGFRPRIFRKSAKGKWVWISSKANDFYGNKSGMVIKGKLHRSGGTEQ